MDFDTLIAALQKARANFAAHVGREPGWEPEVWIETEHGFHSIGSVYGADGGLYIVTRRLSEGPAPSRAVVEGSV